MLKCLAMAFCDAYKILPNHWVIINVSKERKQIWKDECKLMSMSEGWFQFFIFTIFPSSWTFSTSGWTLNLLCQGGCPSMSPLVQATPGHPPHHLHISCLLTKLNYHLLSPLRRRPPCGWSKWTRYQFSRWCFKTVFPRTGKPTLS